MDYISVKETAKLWGIDSSRIGRLARAGRIEGAKLVGRNWLIPKNAVKPSDKRTNAAKFEPQPTAFRLPIFAGLAEKNLEWPLSQEEELILVAEKEFFACEFEKAYASFKPLYDHANSLYIRITATYFMCLLAVAYDVRIGYDAMLNRLKKMLSGDFPYQKEMQLLIPLLNYYIGMYHSVVEEFSIDYQYDYHPSVYCLCEYLSFYQFVVENAGKENMTFVDEYEIICKQMEDSGHYYEAQCLHQAFFVSYIIMQKDDAKMYHLQKMIKLAKEHNLMYSIADLEPYYTDVYRRALSDYPEEFGQKVKSAGKQILNGYAEFISKNEKISAFSKLSKMDCIYLIYTFHKYTNKEIATALKISERTVANNFARIYEILGTKGKQDLCNMISTLL